MHFSLRQLEVFVVIAQQGTVSAAAERLAMSQSAASTALGELERQFEVQLFDRHGRSLRLNATGQALLPRAVALLDQAAELEDMLARRTVFGELRIGATLTVGNYLATLVVADFLQRHPDARIQLTVHNTAAIVDALGRFELDLGLVEGECQRPELVVEPWVADELVVFAPPGHPLAQAGRASWRQLLAERWILREPGSGTRATFQEAIARLPGPIQVRLELEHTEAIKRSVESGLGIGCISRLALREAFRRGSLAPVECLELNLSRHFNFVWHRQKYQTAGFRAFVERCRAYTVGVDRSDHIDLPFIP
ncbi:MAG: LysR substrate-binding domain-containing protein [Rhodocyclaceae bacterium]|nr:LysR substrate-binding domain-containing protein [Rhodocyclaceae bacterium]